MAAPEPSGSECPWDEIERFTGSREVARFSEWMTDQIAHGLAVELSAPADKKVLGWRYFRHLASGQVWQLTAPDGPLVPSFRRVAWGSFLPSPEP